MAQVTIYTTPTCGYCRAAKEYFKEHHIEYTEYDVAADRDRAREMIEKSGQMGVPVILIDNEGKQELVVGFDQPRLAAALGIAS